MNGLILNPEQHLQTELTRLDLDSRRYELTKLEAGAWAQSGLVPRAYENNVAGCTIAMQIAHRMDLDPLTVMQNLHVIRGKPSWSAQFLTAVFNRHPAFTRLTYKYSGKKGTDSRSCYAYATEVETGQVVEGPEVSIAMAKAEGWYGKDGSKWKTLPELMLRYRAAAFFVRTEAPEIGLGLLTVEEAHDVDDDSSDPGPKQADGFDRLMNAKPSVSGPETPAEEQTATESDPPAEYDSEAYKRWKKTLDGCTTEAALNEAIEAITGDGNLSQNERDELLGVCAEFLELCRSGGEVEA